MAINILKELMHLTEEEKEILQKAKEIDKGIYTSHSNFIIEIDRLLDKDKMIMIRKHTRFVHFPRHKHDYIEMNYVYNGQLRQKVGDRSLTLKKGELLLLNQHIEHEIEPCNGEDIVINFIIRAEFFDFIFGYLNTDNIISHFLMNSLYNITHNGQFLYYKIQDVESIQDIIGKIIVEIMDPSTLSESTIKFHMGLLMIELIRHSNRVERNEEASIQHAMIIQVLKYIDEKYQSASLYELAGVTNQTHYGLSKAIKKATGKTFKELLQERRLVKAKELLVNTDLPIASIVDEVGYDNISYFYRIFKNKYGETPKEMRNNN